jgi:tRNA G10  N-methylase Trm11
MHILTLGRQPELGLAELAALYGNSNVQYLNNNIALINDIEQIDFKRLGGSTRLAEVIYRDNFTGWPKVFNEISSRITKIVHEIPEGKIRLGLSYFGDSSLSPQKLKSNSFQLKKHIKKSRESGSVRVVPNDTPVLSTAQVVNNQLTGKTGIEILIIKSRDEIILGRTTEVQNLKSYTIRDRGRPWRDARVGMLPPKLAQTIINLAAGSTNPGSSVNLLDPFCGTGVILQEALLMGFSVTGSDIEQKMVDYTSYNLDWLQEAQKDAPTTKETPRRDVSTADATKHLWSPTPDIVACETYLGRPLSHEPDQETLKKIMNDCDTIHQKFLKNLASQLKPNTRICLAIPAWFVKNRIYHLKVLDIIAHLGYNRLQFNHFAPGDLIYHREGQIVGREIVVLVRR